MGALALSLDADTDGRRVKKAFLHTVLQMVREGRYPLLLVTPAHLPAFATRNVEAQGIKTQLRLCELSYGDMWKA